MLSAARACHAMFLAFLVASSAAAQSGAVRGSVVDMDGKPVKGAIIRALNPNRHPPELTTVSDDKGRFGMIGLVGGVWSFVSEAPGFLTQQARAMVRSSISSNSPIRFVMRRVAPPAPSSLTREVEQQIAEARAHLTEGRLDRAIAAYQAIAKENPALTSVALVIGDAHRRKADGEAGAAREASLERAAASFGEVLKAEPEHVRARVELAAVHLARGRMADAAALLAAGEEAGADGELVCALAEVALAQGDREKATGLFLRAAAMDPTWARPRLRLGQMAMADGDAVTPAAVFRAATRSADEAATVAEARQRLQALGY